MFRYLKSGNYQKYFLQLITPKKEKLRPLKPNQRPIQTRKYLTKPPQRKACKSDKDQIEYISKKFQEFCKEKNIQIDKREYDSESESTVDASVPL